MKTDEQMKAELVEQSKALVENILEQLNDENIIALRELALGILIEQSKNKEF